MFVIDAGRTMGSTCACIAEAVLSTLVAWFTFTPHTVDLQQYSLSLITCLSTGVAAITGIASITREWAGTGQAPARSDVLWIIWNELQPVGYDLFEYTDSVEFVLASFGCILPILGILGPRVAIMVVYGPSFRPNFVEMGVLGLFTAVCVWFLSHFIGRFTVDQRLRLKNASRTQPSCRLVRTSLQVSGMAYAILLHFSRIPSIWRWGLIMIHSTRLSNVLVALRSINAGGGVAGAAVEFADDRRERAHVARPVAQ